MTELDYYLDGSDPDDALTWDDDPPTLILSPDDRGAFIARQVEALAHALADWRAAQRGEVLPFEAFHEEDRE